LVSGGNLNAAMFRQQLLTGFGFNLLEDSEWHGHRGCVIAAFTDDLRGVARWLSSR
jgi:hypothetical protein